MPYDSLLFDAYYQELSGSLSEFAFKYTEQNKIDLTEDEFIQNYTISDNVVSELEAYHASFGKPKIQTSILNQTIRESLATSIKAKIGKQLFNDLVFFKILHAEDPVVIEALNSQKSYLKLTQKISE